MDTRKVSEIAEDKSDNYIEGLHFRNEQLKKTEARYHKMVSAILDFAIILLDEEGNILDWNKGAELLKGYGADEILGKNFRLFYQIEDQQSNLPERLLAEAAKFGFVNHEGYRVRKNGQHFWGSVVITALRDETGLLIGFSKVTKDLTKRKVNEDRYSLIAQELRLKNEELKKSEERYHNMIAEVQDYAIILLNTSGDVQNWNAGAALIKGYSADEIVGENFKIFYTPEDIESGYPDKLLKEAETLGKASSEGWRKRKDGTLFWGSIVITALHHSDGELIGFSKVTRDLTQRKKNEDNLKRQTLELELKNLELEKLNKELSSFAYVVSHDFKEPIRKIQVFGSRQLEPENTIDQIKAYSQKIISSAEKMQALMGALLSYSLISSDPTIATTVDLNEALESAKDDLELRISDTNATINTVKLPIITGVGFQLHQMFLNLLSNALKFTKNGESPSISVTCKIVAGEELPEDLIPKNKTYYQINFADEGIGFDPEYSRRIFDVFQRLRPKSDIHGTGIGLTIVKRIVMNHNGLVIAVSKPNEGSTFQIYLPVN